MGNKNNCGNEAYKISRYSHNTMKGKISMAKNNKMDTEVKVRLYLEEKGLLKKSSEEVGLSMSDYIRSIIFSDKKLVLLTEGSEIAKSLFLIRTDLEHFRKCESFPQEAVEPLMGTLNDVYTKLYELTEKLSDIHADEEGCENE